MIYTSLCSGSDMLKIAEIIFCLPSLWSPGLILYQIHLVKTIIYLKTKGNTMLVRKGYFQPVTPSSSDKLVLKNV